MLFTILLKVWSNKANTVRMKKHFNQKFVIAMSKEDDEHLQNTIKC